MDFHKGMDKVWDAGRWEVSLDQGGQTVRLLSPGLGKKKPLEDLVRGAPWRRLLTQGAALKDGCKQTWLRALGGLILASLWDARFLCPLYSVAAHITSAPPPLVHYSSSLA